MLQIINQLNQTIITNTAMSTIKTDGMVIAKTDENYIPTTYKTMNGKYVKDVFKKYDEMYKSRWPIGGVCLMVRTFKNHMKYF